MTRFLSAKLTLCAATTLFVWQASNAVGAEPQVAPPAVLSKPVAPDEAAGIIFERQQIMLKLRDDGDVVGSIVAQEIPPTKLAEVTRSIANGARESYASFRANVPGGRARPEVWSNWADFSQRMESFVRNSEATAKLAETGNVAAVTSTLGDALPCKQCHDVYRTPKIN